jgi:hypothetical protein
VTGYARKLRKLRLLICPYGTLIAASNRQLVRQLMMEITREAAAFNQKHTDADTRIWNCYVVEPLAGPRLQGVQGWARRRVRDGDAETRLAIKAAGLD